MPGRFKTVETGEYGAKASFETSLELSIAEGLLKQFSMIAAHPDGETKGGHQKFRLLTPNECVERACAVTELFLEEVVRRDWAAQAKAYKSTKPAESKTSD